MPFGLGFFASGAGLANLVAGYFAGGQSSGTLQTVVNKFTFPSDTRTTLATGLSAATIGFAGFANTGVAGYFGGGDSSGATAKVEKFAFPADTRSLLATGLSTATADVSAMANKGVAGYVAGGFARTTIDKFTFPGDTRTTLGTGLSEARSSAAGFSNYATAGYIAGGRNDNIGSFVSSVDKIAFPGDTRTTLATGLSTARGQYPASFGNTNVAGYVAGGRDASFVVQSSVDKFSFPTDTRTTLATGLSTPTMAFAGCSNDATAGYVAGGEAPNDTTRVEKFTFSTDVRSNVSAGLSVAVSLLAGMADS